VEGVLNPDFTDGVSAKERVKQLAEGHEVELWRLVTQFRFDSPGHRPKRTSVKTIGRSSQSRTLPRSELMIAVSMQRK